MKKTSSRLVALLAFFGLILAPVALSAAEFRTGDAPSHPAGETITDDLYLIGGSITSSGTVRGDLILTGGNILVNGSVSGDVAAAGGNISILGNVGDDIRVGGGTVVIQGAITGDVLVGGGQVTIAGTRVGGDVAVAGGMIRIDAPVTGDVRIGGGEVHINSTIGGNVEIQAEKITLGPKAVINGTLTYKSPNEAVLAEGAVVRGKTTYTPSPDVRQAARDGLIAFFSIWVIAKMIMIFSGALVIGYVFQRYAAEFVSRATEKPLGELARGVVFFILTPILAVILLMTVIGMLFGILGLLGWIAMLIFGSMLTPLLIGAVVHKFIFKPAEYLIDWKTILLGTALYFAVGVIPVIGGLVCFLAMILAIGAAIHIKSDALSEWR